MTENASSGPLVSIIMSVFNCASTLAAALNSIKAQTYSNWELIVCDDASNDGTLAILEAFRDDVPASRVVIIKNPVNRKLAYSLNRCLEAASGEFVARMDGDDLSEPERLDRQMQYLLSHDDVALVGTAMRRFNHRGLGDVLHPASSTPDKWTLGRSSRVPFFHATILARRHVFDAVGNYTVSWRTERGQDVDLWYKFFAAGFIGRNLPDALYRVREDEAAVRRRTPRARFGGYVTRLKGSWSLRYPLSAYIRCTIDLMKIFVPYQVYDWHRRRSAARSNPVSN